MKPKIQQLTDLLQVAGNSPTVTEHRYISILVTTVISSPYNPARPSVYGEDSGCR